MKTCDALYGHTIQVVWPIHAIWSSFVGEVSAILAELPERTWNAGGFHTRETTMVVGLDGLESDPVLNRTEVAFAGLRTTPLTTPFRLSPRPATYRVITDRQPFDFAVCCSLIALQDLAADRVCITTSSTEEDRQHAESFMADHFGIEPRHLFSD